jgi:hypothetical protein
MVHNRRAIVARALPEGLEVAAEAFDVGAARTEDRQALFGAPGHVLAQVKRVRLAGQTAVTSQESREREFFFGAEQHLTHGER